MSGPTGWLIAALTAEWLLILMVLLGLSWWRNRAARRRDAAAIEKLVKRIKTARSDREAAISDFLQSRLGLSGEPLARAKIALGRAEIVLLQRFAAVYRKRDAGGAELFDADVFAAVEPYLALRAAGGDADAGPADPGELQRLLAENERLTEELRVTMETMSRMLNEYSTLFAGAEPEVVAPIAGVVGGGATAAAVPGSHEGNAAVEASEQRIAPPDVDVSSEESSFTGRASAVPEAPGMPVEVDYDQGDGAGEPVGHTEGCLEGPSTRSQGGRQGVPASGVAGSDEGRRSDDRADRAPPLDDALSALLEEGEVDVMSFDEDPVTDDEAEGLPEPTASMGVGDDGVPELDADLFDDVETTTQGASFDETDGSAREAYSRG